MDESLLITATAFEAPAGASEGDVRRMVEAACRGETWAFEEIYRRYHRMVHGLLLSRVPAGDADDVLQDVFLQAWRRLPTLKEPAALGAWLATMARHRAVDYLRARPATEPLGDEAGGIARPDAQLHAARALAAIRALPAAYREPLLLRLVEGMTGPEIAERIGLTPGSVRVNLCRGMKLLRQRLEGGDIHGR